MVRPQMFRRYERLRVGTVEEAQKIPADRCARVHRTDSGDPSRCVPERSDRGGDEDSAPQGVELGGADPG